MEKKTGKEVSHLFFAATKTGCNEPNTVLKDGRKMPAGLQDHPKGNHAVFSSGTRHLSHGDPQHFFHSGGTGQ